MSTRLRVPGKTLKPAQGQPLLPLATVLEALNRSKQSGPIDAVALQQALGLRSRYLAQRLLAALGSNGGFADAGDFAAAAQRVMSASPARKLEFLFRLHDEDGDGWIRREEVDRLLHIAAAENELRLSDPELDELVGAVMEEGDHDSDGRISMAEFVRMMVAHPNVEQHLSDYGVSLLMPGKRARRMMLVPGSSWRGWVRNQAVLAAWLIVYFAANVVLFADAFIRYRAAGANTCVQVARGCGACLNMNAALIVVPMLRHTLTWVRRSRLAALAPVDDAVSFHGLIGEVTVLLSLVHSGAHLLNIAHGGARLGSVANATGIAMLELMILMWVCSRGFVRRLGRFELFYTTHLAYFGLMALLFVHGPRFWLWGTVPWLWFLIERSLRSRRRRAPSRVLKARALASGVTHLEFERPPGFSYAPGDYVFVRLPSIARHEWHPFTLTSAPESPERLSVHVRSAGNWTSTVRERLPALLGSNTEVLAHVDGPYGTASRHLLEVPHAVAIAGGIGVTPFASILQSLLLRQADPNSPSYPLRKLHFVWLNRDQDSFEWFRELLFALEQRDHSGLLDVHTFLTAGRADMAGSVLEVARHLIGLRGRGDHITGLRSRTNFGAPDFDRLLERFYRNPDLPHPEVFFCGPKPLERVVERSCRRLGLRLRSERF